MKPEGWGATAVRLTAVVALIVLGLSLLSGPGIVCAQPATGAQAAGPNGPEGPPWRWPLALPLLFLAFVAMASVTASVYRRDRRRERGHGRRRSRC